MEEPSLKEYEAKTAQLLHFTVIEIILRLTKYENATPDLPAYRWHWLPIDARPELEVFIPEEERLMAGTNLTEEPIPLHMPVVTARIRGDQAEGEITLHTPLGQRKMKFRVGWDEQYKVGAIWFAAGPGKAVWP